MLAAALSGQRSTIGAVTACSRVTHASRTSHVPSSSPPQGTKSGQLAFGTSGRPDDAPAEPSPHEPPFPLSPPASPAAAFEQARAGATSKAVKRRTKLRYHAGLLRPVLPVFALVLAVLSGVSACVPRAPELYGKAILLIDRGRYDEAEKYAGAFERAWAAPLPPGLARRLAAVRQKP